MILPIYKSQQVGERGEGGDAREGLPVKAPEGAQSLERAPPARRPPAAGESVVVVALRGGRWAEVRSGVRV